MNRSSLTSLSIVGLMLLSVFSTVPFVDAVDGAGGQVVPEQAPPVDIPAGTDSSHGFIENLGQMSDDGISFYLDSPGLGVALLDGAMLLDVRASPSSDGPLVGSARLDPWDPLHGDERPKSDVRAGCVVRLGFVGAEASRPVGRAVLPGTYNYIIGNDPSMWLTGARAYSVVAYEGLYPGIDLVLRTSPAGLKSEFVVAPGADPAAIVVRAEGQTSLDVRDGTILAIGTVAGTVVDDGLVAYQMDEPSSPVTCSFELVSSDTYAFRVGARDPSRPLVIDPLIYSTFLGDASTEYINDIAIDDSDGAVYLCGGTYSRQFPTTAGAYQVDMNGWADGFVTKLSADGTTLVYSTLLGGSMEERVVGLDVDDAGNAYLAGSTTSDDFPTTPGVVQPTLHEGWNSTDCFVCKLDPTGASLAYSTFVGGSASEWIASIDVDDSRCAYFTGSTDSDDFPVTPGAYQNSTTSYQTMFVCKLNANATRFVYSTFLSSGQMYDNTYSSDIVVDGAGCAYVVGQTESSTFPVTDGAYSTRLSGSYDGFVTKLDADGSDLVWSTLLGGAEYERVSGIVLGAGDAPVVTGYTDSLDFPTTDGAYQETTEGYSSDAFVTILSPDATSLNVSTFIGGSSGESDVKVCVDPFGSVSVFGCTSSDDFPTTEDAEQPDIDGYMDTFVTTLSSDLSDLVYSTYLGGSEYEQSAGIVHDANYTLCVAGYTSSDDFPVTLDAYQGNFEGGYDGFLWKMLLDSEPPVAIAGEDVTIDQHQTVELNGSMSSDNLGLATWMWTFRYNGSDVYLYGPLNTFRFDVAGRYEVTLTVLDLAHLKGTDWLNVTVRDITRPVAVAGTDMLIDQHQSVALDGTGSSDNVGIVNFTWTLTYRGEGVTLGGPGPAFTFDDAGTYPIGLNVSDEAGNWATDSLTVMVKDVTRPTADAGPDAIVEQHATVAFNGSASMDNVGIVNYTWSFVCGDQPVTLYGPAPSYVFEIAGKYTVTLTVADEMGNVASDTVKVEVLDTVPPTAEAGPDATVLQGQTYEFNGRGSKDNVAIYSWTWTFDYWGISTTLEGPGPQFVFELAGTFLVTLTVMDNVGSTAQDTMTVTVRDLESPVARAGYDVGIDQHAVASLDGSASTDNLGIVNWTWTFDYRGSRVELHGATAGFAFDDAGSIEVELAVSDAAGNHATDTVVVNVRDATPPHADAGPNATIEQGSALTLEGGRSTDNVAVTSWTWTFTYDDSPVQLLGRSQNYTFGRPGTYVVTLKVEDAQRLSDETTITVRVRDTVDPTVVAPSPITVAKGDRVTLDGSSSSDNVGVVTWEWTFTDGGKDVKLNGSKVSYAFKDEGDHVVTLTTFDAEGNAAAQTFTVTVEGGASVLYIAVIAIAILHVAIAAVWLRGRGRKAA